MPVTTRKTDGYTVSTPGGVKGRGMTKLNAERQARLLRGVEHGWKPTGKPARDTQKKAGNPRPYPLRRYTKPTEKPFGLRKWASKRVYAPTKRRKRGLLGRSYRTLRSVFRGRRGTVPTRRRRTPTQVMAVRG